MSEKKRCEKCGIGLRMDPEKGLVHPVYARCPFSNRVMMTGNAFVEKSKKVEKEKTSVVSSGPQIPPKETPDE